MVLCNRNGDKEKALKQDCIISTTIRIKCIYGHRWLLDISTASMRRKRVHELTNQQLVCVIKGIIVSLLPCLDETWWRNVVILAPMTVQKGIIGYEDLDRRMRWTYALIYSCMYFWRVLKSTVYSAFIGVPLLRSLSRNSAKYMRTYYVSFGFKKSDDIVTKRQSTKRLHVCSHLEKRAAATTFINIFHPDARWPTVDGCPTRSIINFVELDATISSLKVSSGARLLRVAMGWPRICSTRCRMRCYNTSSTLAFTVGSSATRKGA
jgi:hypothetical protein